MTTKTKRAGRTHAPKRFDRYTTVARCGARSTRMLGLVSGAKMVKKGERVTCRRCNP